MIRNLLAFPSPQLAGADGKAPRVVESVDVPRPVAVVPLPDHCTVYL